MSPIIPIGVFRVSRPSTGLSSRWPWHQSSRRMVLIVTAYLLICFNPQQLFAEDFSKSKDLANHYRQYDFAQSLFAKGQFIKAAAEFDRFVFFFPNDPRVPQARYQAAHAYFKGSRFDDVVSACQTVIGTSPNAVDTAQFYLLLARARIKQEDFNQALVTLHNLLSIYQDPAIQDEARYLGAWIFIQTAQWPKALAWLNAISDQNRNGYAVEPITQKLSAINEIPHKHPRLAGFLAVFPGMGHVYTGRFQDALTAFLLNSLTIWGAYEAFDDDHPGLGSLLGLVGLNFYVGNIYSAVNTAHQFNRRANEQFIRSLKPYANLRLSVRPEDGGGVVMVSIDF